MVIRLAVQSASNMPSQRTSLLVVPTLCCALLAVCCCTVLHRSNAARSDDTVSRSIDCDHEKNSTECATGMKEMGSRRRGKDQSLTVGQSRIEESKSEDGAIVEQVTGRRKKNKGYGQMLLYFLGASKMTMLYVIMNAVAAIAGKALIVAKVALAIATAIALRKILDKERISYEIIKYPYHSYENTHSTSFDYDHHGGSWERDFGYQRQRVNRKLVR
ncbi:uncharacterized protein LOC105736236 isoform X2 [Apis florea]|uniref:uncharacterized protein LOC105736236 isoform X2 n=1 Tax=Apis florea TaxID=7463 RepID=UPI0012FE8031|nr:uncharacterized protein LOC105736236 isoform X2 [Apis florea]